ncbi:hypothetical protein GCM10010294_45980 [Streptomyces griseoloalbus]|uniref:hypothetical protein n=1 Tax=Streptomyces griseoloalbus TaxID=67303 RepID=UPI0019B8B8D2|nr:hypothetical protein GCM10010294_45980 [Streptomyces griseoloalbus]
MSFKDFDAGKLTALANDLDTFTGNAGKVHSQLAALLIRSLAASIGSRTPAPILDALTGKDILAAHSGRQWAWEANLLTVGKNPGALNRATGASRLSAFASGAGTALRTGGFWRTAGIGGSAVSTVIGAVDLVQEGNFVEAFKRDKAGYVAKAPA